MLEKNRASRTISNQIVGVLQDGSVFVLDTLFEYDGGFKGATHYTMAPLTQEQINSANDDCDDHCRDIWELAVAEGRTTKGLTAFTQELKDEKPNDEYFLFDDPSFRREMEQAYKDLPEDAREKLDAYVGKKGRDFVDWDCVSLGRAGKLDPKDFALILNPELLDAINKIEGGITPLKVNTTALFLDCYDNVYNEDAYIRGYLDALCVLDNFLVFTEEQNKALNEAKQLLNKRLGA